MSNRRGDPVGYRKLRADPLLSEGLLGVSREGGDLERRVASAFFRMADEAGVYADRQAARLGTIEGGQAALAGRPGPAAVSGNAGFLPAAEGGAIAAADLPGDVNERGAYVRNYLQEKHGLQPHMAAALAGHGIQESGLRPTGAVGDNGTAFGVFQWRNERFDALKAFASEGGRNWQDLDTQLDFAVHELQTSEKFAGEQLLASRDVEEAVAAFMHFERPKGWSRDNPRGGHAFKNRLANAAALAGEAAVAPAAVANTQVAQAVQPPGVVTVSSGGRGGGYRPSGRDTIRGRAYDAAGTRTYLQQLDATMREDVQSVYDAAKDDPVELRRKMEALRKVHLDEHVFPEIAADYEVAFQRLSSNFIRDADQRAENRRQEQNRASFIERTSALETARARRLADFDPAADNAAETVLSVQASIDDHYDAAVAHGIMDAGQAAEAKIISRREAAIGFYARQAETLDAAGISALREEMRADFAAGELDGLDGAGWGELDTYFQRLERTALTQAKKANDALTDRGDTMASRIAEGYDVDQGEVGKLMLDGRTAPGGPAIVLESMDKIGIARVIRDMPLGEAERVVTEFRRERLAGGSEADRRAADFAEKALATKRKALKDDPLTYAERLGVIDASPVLDPMAEPDAVAALMRSRAMDGAAVAEHFGVPPRYLKPGEAAAVSSVLKSDPAKGAEIAGAIVSGAGLRIGEVLQEFSGDAPELEQAGAIMAFGGSAQAAADVIAGHGKGPDGRAWPNVSTADRRTFASAVIGDALLAQPRDRGRIEAAAQAIARKRIAEAGVGDDADARQEIYTRALNEAAGAIYDRGVQFGGFASLGGSLWSDGTRVVVPPEIRADRFGDVLAALTDEDLMRGRFPPIDRNGNVFSAEDLRRAVPVAVKGGYRFALGDPASDAPLYVSTADGRPFTLNVAAMRQRLEPRTPGAWR